MLRVRPRSEATSTCRPFCRQRSNHPAESQHRNRACRRLRRRRQGACYVLHRLLKKPSTDQFQHGLFLPGVGLFGETNVDRLLMRITAGAPLCHKTAAHHSGSFCPGCLDELLGWMPFEVQLLDAQPPAATRRFYYGGKCRTQQLARAAGCVFDSTGPQRGDCQSRSRKRACKIASAQLIASHQLQSSTAPVRSPLNRQTNRNSRRRDGNAQAAHRRQSKQKTRNRCGPAAPGNSTCQHRAHCGSKRTEGRPASR